MSFLSQVKQHDGDAELRRHRGARPGNLEHRGLRQEAAERDGRGEWSNAHEGETPEDAVARLWLSLHQAAANGAA